MTVTVGVPSTESGIAAGETRVLFSITGLAAYEAAVIYDTPFAAGDSYRLVYDVWHDASLAVSERYVSKDITYEEQMDGRATSSYIPWRTAYKVECSITNNCDGPRSVTTVVNRDPAVARGS